MRWSRARNPVGVMQGRLLPPVSGRLQAFPGDRWAEEFLLARDAALDRIEWIYEPDGADSNPLATDEGVAKIRRLVEETGIDVASVCADYFMYAPLVRAGRVNEASWERLQWLVERCSKLWASYIVLPFVDGSSLDGPGDVDALVAGMRDRATELERFNVSVHLETDLPPSEFRALLASIDHPAVRATYDVGNSASLGFVPDEELAAIGPWLGSVHVKDRVLRGGSVLLGRGNADFVACFRALVGLNYQGPLILQAARDPSRSELELARVNRDFVVRGIEAAAGFDVA